MVQLGNKVRDKVTGFTGIAIGRTDYLFGCRQYGVAPAVGDDGKLNNVCWFDVGRLEVVDTGVSPASVQTDDPGGEGGDIPPSTHDRHG